MSSKKKLVISLSVAAAVLLVAVIAIVAVFAAANQTVTTSNIKVVYTAGDNVVGNVSANYQLHGGSMKSMTTDGNAANGTTNTVISFDVDNNASGTLGIQSSDLTVASVAEGPNDAVEFSEDVRWIVIQFVFTNEGSDAFTATVTETATTATNMVTEYCARNSTTDADWSKTASPVTVAAATLDEGGVTPTEVSYYARVRIDNVAFDAGYAGTFSWALAV